MNAKYAEIIEKRLHRAHEELKNAQLLANEGQWNAAANRVYYASFYAVSALLLDSGHRTVTHKGVGNLFNAHFVKSGKISKEHGQMFSQVFQKRQKSDYDDDFDATEEDVLPFFASVAELITAIEEMIND